MIISLGKQEAVSIIEETGFIEVTCEFCRKVYKFSEEEVMSLIPDSDK
jgi:molecular chaperone Hsp33